MTGRQSGRMPWYQWPWPKVRLEILARDGWKCQIRGPKCKGHADQVDHVVAPGKGGAWFDAANLRAACNPCNQGRKDRSQDDGWKRSATRITLVIGPPGTGSKHVEQHRRDGDLVVDYERIAAALGGSDDSLHKTILKARSSILNDVRRGKVDARHVWIISANPRAEELFPYHERIVIDDDDDEVEAQGNEASKAGLAAWRAARAGDQPSQAGSSRQWLSE